MKYTVFNIEAEDSRSKKLLKSTIKHLTSKGVRLLLVEGEHAKTRHTMDKVVVADNFVKAQLGLKGGIKSLLDNVVTSYTIVLALNTRIPLDNAIDMFFHSDYVLVKRSNNEARLPLKPSIIADYILELSVEDLVSKLPNLNCRGCGYNTCKELAEAAVKSGNILECPVTLDFKLVVNGWEVKLKPYPKLVMLKVVEAFLSTLKDVPEPIREVRLEFRRS